MCIFCYYVSAALCHFFFFDKCYINNQLIILITIFGKYDLYLCFMPTSLQNLLRRHILERMQNKMQFMVSRPDSILLLSFG